MKKLIFLPMIIFCLFLSAFPFSCSQSKSESEKITRLARDYINALKEGDFTKAAVHFDAAMKTAAPPDQLGMIWFSITANAGPFKKFTGHRIERGKGLKRVIVSCEFEYLLMDLIVVFNRADQICGFFIGKSESLDKYAIPDYVQPDSFQENEVMVGEGAWALPGTLSLPVENPPYAAVVLVHGSGPHDRDESIGPNKPFKDLAWGLASKGIAVLRYDKRTKAHQERFASITDHITVKEETIDDALAAISLLRQTKKIDPEKIFVLGHSLGGTLIPRIGLADKDITGFIVMAGSTRPLEDVILEQVTYLASLDGETTAEENKELEKIKAKVSRVKNLNLSDKMPSSDLLLGISAKYWLDLRGYNPAKAASRLKHPMLILQGERDYQVTMEDFRLWKESLKDRENVTFKSYPELNHLFMSGEGKSIPAEYEKAGHVAESVMNDITIWIMAQ